jgi:hypothetical protein
VVRIRPLGVSIYLVIGSQLLIGCGEFANRASLVGEQNQINEASAPYDVNKYKSSKLICDPFDPTEPGATHQNGLKAQLYYLSEDQPRYESVSEYIEFGNKSAGDLFFSSVNVPTRLFDAGFPTETGELVKDDSNNVLFEYFALKMTAELQLSDDQEDGLYELALLSDDGTVMKLADLSDEMQVVVDNDGNHPTRFGCGDIIEMRKGESIPMELLYYQGPRHHISVIPMWRKVEDRVDHERDPLCGVKGNRKYFDYNNNSEPQQAYKDLLTRGWEPIETGNYKVTDDDYNPCNDEQKPVISEMYVIDILDGGVRVTWKTDIPATSHVIYTSSRDGVPVTTTSDNVLRTEHSVIIPDTTGGESYIVRAVSASATMARTISGGITYRNYNF